MYTIRLLGYIGCVVFFKHVLKMISLPASFQIQYMRMSNTINILLWVELGVRSDLEICREPEVQSKEFWGKMKSSANQTFSVSDSV